MINVTEVDTDIETFESTERMEERVRTLLRQVENLRSHGEDHTADVALAKAELIMLKYNIDRAVVEATRSVDQRDPIDQWWVPFTGIYRAAVVPAMYRLVEAYSSTVRSFVSVSGNTHYLALVGRAGETTSLRMLIASLQLQASAGMNVWWRSARSSYEQLTSMERFKARRQFVASFIEGATERVRVARQVVTQRATDTTPGTALVLRDYRAEVDRYVAEHFRLHRSRSRLAAGEVGAARDGYRAGQRANTGDTPLTSERRRLTT
jgi:hypothetical protein